VLLPALGLAPALLLLFHLLSQLGLDLLFPVCVCVCVCGGACVVVRVRVRAPTMRL
jgi:hypothetical protein